MPGLIYAHVYEAEDAISENDSRVRAGLSENLNFTETMAHRIPHLTNRYQILEENPAAVLVEASGTPAASATSAYPSRVALER